MESTFILRLMYVVQIVLASRGMAQSYGAIIHLHEYEGTVKKLAKYSAEAERQLLKTRTTQSSGALAVFTSFLSALLLAVFAPYLPPWLRFCASPVLLLSVLFAQRHVKSYWAPYDGKTAGPRIPLPSMEDYNEALRRTEALLDTLEHLEYGWVACSFVATMLGWR